MRFDVVETVDPNSLPPYIWWRIRVLREQPGLLLIRWFTVGWKVGVMLVGLVSELVDWCCLFGGGFFVVLRMFGDGWYLSLIDWSKVCQKTDEFSTLSSTMWKLTLIILRWLIWMRFVKDFCCCGVAELIGGWGPWWWWTGVEWLVRFVWTSPIGLLTPSEVFRGTLWPFSLMSCSLMVFEFVVDGASRFWNKAWGLRSALLKYKIMNKVLFALDQGQDRRIGSLFVQKKEWVYLCAGSWWFRSWYPEGRSWVGNPRGVAVLVSKGEK